MYRRSRCSEGVNLLSAVGHIVLFIEQQSSKTPHAIAVTDGSISLTYAELASRSNALAAYLHSLDVGPEAVVAVCMPRSVAQIIAALGVMKAGAAYLPLDPAGPQERLLSRLQDAAAHIALIAADSPGAHWGQTRTIVLDADGIADAACRDTHAIAHVPSGDLAYVIYTSGSTGEPKGVEITHGGLANLVEWHRAAFEVQSADRASHISAVGFDAAVWEVWPYLCVGASVHIAADAIARDPRALRDWLIANQITIAFASTPIAEQLIDFAYPPQTALRIVLTGADTLHRYPPPTLPFALYNNYGPTEATVVATSGLIATSDDAGDLPSIGRPIAQTDIFILDGNDLPVADGVAGEICIAGPGLARAYRNQPELTERQFPLLALRGPTPIRVYRTGDRGRRRADGRIAHLGRIDDQVKIRGFRVEPREIEAALDAHASVSASAVVVRDYGPGDERIAAYVVARAGYRIDLADVQAFLGARLPAYMLPATFEELAALPLTANGKIDRAQLRTREAGPRLVAETYVAARTVTERQLAQILAALLKLERISVDDDFFRLGGHSLLGTQLIARIRDAFNAKIGLRFLFESPTIAALAREIDRQRLEQREPTETAR